MVEDRQDETAVEEEWLGYEEAQGREDNGTVPLVVGFETEPKIKDLLTKVLEGYLGKILGSTIETIKFQEEARSSAYTPEDSRPHAEFINGDIKWVDKEGNRFISNRGIIAFDKASMQEGFSELGEEYEFFLFKTLLHEWGHSITPYNGHDNKAVDEWKTIVEDSEEELPSYYVQKIDSFWGPLKHEEDFAESIVFYLSKNEWFKNRCPRRSDFIQKYFQKHEEHFLTPNLEKTQEQFNAIQRPRPRGVI